MMGIDDPHRSFVGEQPVKDDDRARMEELVFQLHRDDSRREILTELSQSCLPTLIRARVESEFPRDDKLYFLWYEIVDRCHTLPSVGR